MVAAAAAMAGGCHGGTAAPAATGAWSCGGLHAGKDPHLARRLGGHGRLTLGAVADSNGATAETLANLERLSRVFAGEHVDAVAALGDLGRTEDEIAAVLGALKAAGAPVLALAGEREDETVFHAAVNRARNAGVDVVDLVEKRIIDTGEMDIVSVPGYPFSKDGCRYTADDLHQLEAALGQPMRPVVLLAHTPPKGDGPRAPDRALGDVNAGDPALLDFVNAVYPNAVLFAHVDEAGGRSTARGLVNVGAAEHGQGAIVALRDGIATVRVLP